MQGGCDDIIIMVYVPNFSGILEFFLKENILIFFSSNKWGYMVTRMKIFCETKHLSTLAEELWRTASTRFLVKTITIWSQLLWYWPNLYERSVILINAQFILSPHLLFPSVWQNLSEWKCKCFAIYILFSTGSIYWYSNIFSGRHLEPGLFLLWTGYWNICYWPH